MSISYVLADIIIDYFYRKTFSVCRPLFPHPFWSWGTAFLGSTLTAFLVEVFNKKDNSLSLVLALFTFFTIKGLLLLYQYGYDDKIFENIVYIYKQKETLIFSIIFLTIVTLRRE